MIEIPHPRHDPDQQQNLISCC